jgi:hypothetical protein
MSNDRPKRETIPVEEATVSKREAQGVLYLDSEPCQDTSYDPSGVRDRWDQGLRSPWVSETGIGASKVQYGASSPGARKESAS